MQVRGQKGICFVISPIGDEGTDIRRRADSVFKYVIEPVVNESGYKAVRADQIPKPGTITSQIIQHLAEDPLVIADLAGHNPNVFYELAIRHVTRKPVIQITQVGEKIPFDVAPNRTIQLDHKDLESAAICKQNLARQIRSLEKNPNDFDNPISTAVDLQLLRQSGSPIEKGNARILEMLSDLRTMVGQMKTSSEAASRQLGIKSEAVTLNIEDSTLNDLSSLASARGITVPELIRKVILPQWAGEELYMVEQEARSTSEMESQAEEDALRDEAEAEARGAK